MGEIKDTIDCLLSDYHELRIELERTEELLKVYKKALGLLAEDSIANLCLNVDKQDLIVYYLAKAKESEE